MAPPRISSSPTQPPTSVMHKPIFQAAPQQTDRSGSIQTMVQAQAPTISLPRLRGIGVLLLTFTRPATPSGLIIPVTTTVVRRLMRTTHYRSEERRVGKESTSWWPE